MSRVYCYELSAPITTQYQGELSIPTKEKFSRRRLPRPQIYTFTSIVLQLHLLIQLELIEVTMKEKVTAYLSTGFKCHMR